MVKLTFGSTVATIPMNAEAVSKNLIRIEQARKYIHRFAVLFYLTFAIKSQSTVKITIRITIVKG